MNYAAGVFAQQVGKSREAALLISAQMIVNVPAQIIVAKIKIVLGAAANNVIERIQPKITGFSQLPPERGILDPTPQSPHGVDERQFCEFIPGRAQIPGLMFERT